MLNNNNNIRKRGECTMARKFQTGDFAIYRREKVRIGRARKTTKYGQTYYLVRPMNRTNGGTYVRSDYLETV